MSIGRDRVFTMSAEAWCEMHGRKLYEYTAVGIHYNNQGGIGHLIDQFAAIVPDEAEVVTDYEFSVAVGGAGAGGGFEPRMDLRTEYHASGTALIPKAR